MRADEEAEVELVGRHILDCFVLSLFGLEDLDCEP